MMWLTSMISAFRTWSSTCMQFHLPWPWTNRPRPYAAFWRPLSWLETPVMALLPWAFCRRFERFWEKNLTTLYGGVVQSCSWRAPVLQSLASILTPFGLQDHQKHPSKCFGAKLCRIIGLTGIRLDIPAIRSQLKSNKFMLAHSQAVEGLLDATSGADPDLLLSYRECHLLVLKALQDGRAYGPQWCNKQITRPVLQLRRKRICHHHRRVLKVLTFSSTPP